MACISSSHCAITGAVAWSSRAHGQEQKQQHGSCKLAMPSSSFCGDAVSSSLHAGICSPLRSGGGSVATRRRGVKARVVESVLAEIAEENVARGDAPDGFGRMS